MLRHVVLLTSLFYFGILTIDRLKQSKTVFTLDLFDGRLLQGIRCVYCESWQRKLYHFKLDFD